MALARDRVILTADVTTAASTNYAPVTGLNFNGSGSRTYHVRVGALFTVAATTTGVRFGLSANPTTAPTFISWLGIGATGAGALAGGSDANTSPRYVTTASTTGGYTALTDSSAASTGANFHIIEGIVVVASTQVIQLEVGPEVAAAVTVKAGTYLEWELLI